MQTEFALLYTIALGMLQFPLQYRSVKRVKQYQYRFFTEGYDMDLQYLFRKEDKPQLTKGRQPF